MEELRTEFEKIGAIESVRLLELGPTGIIVYRTAESAATAVNTLNGQNLFGSSTPVSVELDQVVSLDG